MNALADAIQNAALSGTDAEIVAHLAAEVELSRDHTRWTYAGLAKRFGRELVGQIDETLKATPGLDWVRLSLSSVGLDFGDDETAAGLEQLVTAGLLAPEVAAGLTALAVRRGPRWLQAGLASLPTVDDVAAAKRQIAASQWAAAAWNEVVAPMVETGSDVAAIKAAVLAFGE